MWSNTPVAWDKYSQKWGTFYPTKRSGRHQLLLGPTFLNLQERSPPPPNYSKTHLTPSYTAWTKSPMDVPQDKNTPTILLGSRSSSYSDPGSTALVAQIQSQKNSTSEIFTSMLETNQPNPPLPLAPPLHLSALSSPHRRMVSRVSP